MSEFPTLPNQQYTTARTLEILNRGEFRQQHGVLAWGTNYCFLLTVACGEDEILAIYKPRRGERTLWDFPRGTLCLREVAAYETASALGWALVPPTALREGPHGLGSLQCFIHHDPEQHYFTFGEGNEALLAQLRRLALFDCLINNADRKSGHCLLDAAGQLWGIDHGVCFHSEPKLRTVIWEFAGDALPPALLADLKSFTKENSLIQKLAPLLSEAEIESVWERAQKLLQQGRYPKPGQGPHLPWPPV